MFNHTQSCGLDVLMVISNCTHTYTNVQQQFPAGVNSLHRELLNAVTVPLHKSFQKRVKHSYKLIHKCKNIIQQGNK